MNATVRVESIGHYNAKRIPEKELSRRRAMQYTSSAMGEKMLILGGAAAFTVLATIALLFSIKAGIVLFFGGLLVAVVFFKPFWGLLISFSSRFSSTTP
jgi:uncharacterized membrane protein